MARICGVCRRPPREGQELSPLRVYEDDRPDTEPGLYHACIECKQELAPKVAARLNAARCNQEKVRALVEGRAEQPVRELTSDQLSTNDFC